MKIKMLWGQRICKYEGQFAPELLDAIDEVGDEENPSFILDCHQDCLDTGEFSSLVIVEGIIPDKELGLLLNPSVKVKLK